MFEEVAYSLNPQFLKASRVILEKQNQGEHIRLSPTDPRIQE